MPPAAEAGAARGAASLGWAPRLTAAFLLVALLTLVAGAAGLTGLSRAGQAARLLDQSASMILAVQEIRVAFGGLAEPPATYLATGDPQAPARYADAIAVVRARLADYQAAHSLHRHSVAHAVSAHDLIAATTADVDELERLGQAVFAAPDAASGAARLGALEGLRAGATARLQTLLDNAGEDIAAARAAYDTAQRSATLGLGLSALLAFLLAAGLAWYLARRLTRPLGELGRAAGRIAANDLATPVAVRAPGELGQLAAAFEHMRRMLIYERERARRLAILEERDRIAREMHDGLAQVLGYVNTKAQAAREYLRAGQAETAAQQVEELITAAREAYTEARQAIADLRVAGMVAHERGLAELLREHVERFRQQTGLSAELVVAPDWREADLPPTARVQALRIAQEALANVRKHASAQRVQVSLAAEPGGACLRIDDDGQGFALARLLSPDFTRFGLRTMRERAQAVGGALRIESQPGQGTRIIVHLPRQLPEEASPP